MISAEKHNELIDTLYDAMCLASLVSAATFELDDTPTTAGIRTACETIMTKLGAVQDALEVERQPPPR